MLFWSNENGAVKRANSVFVFSALFLCAILLSEAARADSPTQVPPTSSEWTPGPATINLGTVASFQVKQGYKFLDAAAAKALLERSRNPVPKQLLGILTPTTEDWWVVLQFNNIGYVREQQASPAELAGTLKSLDAQVQQQNSERKGRGLPAFTSVAWVSEPKYDTSVHLLEWAVRKESPGHSVVSQSVRFLGRHGMLDMTVITPYRGFADLAPIKQLAGGLAFNPGEAYADYADGDKVFGAGVANLVVDNGTSMKTPADGELAGTVASGGEKPRNRLRLAIVGGVVLLVVVIGVLVLARRRSRKAPAFSGRAEIREPQAEASPVVQSEAQPSAGGLAESAASEPAAPVKAGIAPARTRPLAFKTNTSAPAPVKSVNGKHHDQRKKVFDYNRYFTDLMTTVSSHSSQMDFPQEMPRNDWPSAEQPQQNLSAITPEFQAELIQSQRLLIEEQRRLIQEQSKIIEDKAKVIAERNKLLKMQSEMLGE